MQGIAFTTRLVMLLITTYKVSNISRALLSYSSMHVVSNLVNYKLDKLPLTTFDVARC